MKMVQNTHARSRNQFFEIAYLTCCTALLKFRDEIYRMKVYTSLCKEMTAHENMNLFRRTKAVRKKH